MSDEAVSMEHAAYVRCRLREDRLLLEIASGNSPIETMTCPLDEVRQALGTGKLDGARLEAAIARTEDRIMPLLDRLPSQAHLQVAGSGMESIQALLPDPGLDHAPITTVEHLFNQLADRAMGSVASWRHEMEIETVAFALIVLRELMHHGGFAACEWPEKQSWT
jgi:hypothetical protein